MKKRFLATAIFILTLFAVSFFKGRQQEFSLRPQEKIDFGAIPEKFKIGEEEHDDSDLAYENPIERLEYEYGMLADPKTGRIPKGIRLKELEFQKKINRENDFNIAMRAVGTQAQQAAAFFSRGPYNIGGRTRALSIDVTNEDIILAGGVSGGLWRTTNGGVTWNRTSEVTQLPAVSALVQDKRTGHTNTWFYSAGEFFGNSASATGAFYLGDGIFKSTDGGQNWEVIENTAQGSNISLGDFGLVSEIIIDNSNTTEREMYAAGLSQIIRTTDDFETYTVVLGANNTGFAFSDVAISSSGIMIATIANNVNNGPNAQEGIYKSEDGLTWININPPSGLSTSYSRIEVAFDPQNEDVFYALGPTFLLKHTISTGQWITLTGNLDVSSDSGQGHNAQGGYNLIAGVHPENSNVLFMGGTNLLRSTNAFQTASSRVNIGGYREDNNSSNFPKYNNHHPDQHALAFYPSDGNKMLTGSDGGVHRTQNNLQAGGNSPVVWESLNNGYLTTQVYAIDAYKFNRGDALLIAGMQDNGTWGAQSLASDEEWTEIFGGDGAFNALTYNSLYVSAQEGQMRRFELIDNTYQFMGDISPSINSDDFLFINPFIYDPVNQDRLYVAARAKVFYTHNIRENPSAGEWLELPIPSGGTNDYVSALAASIEPEGVLYFGTRTGKVFKVSDINSSTVVENITADNLPSGTITSIAVDPRDASKVVLTFGNYGLVSIWRSEDGGQNWNSVSGNLEENINGTGDGPSVRYVEILPNGDTEAIYLAGTSLGLYITNNLEGDNTVWNKEGETTIGNSIVSMIKTRPVEGQVFVATHGNGVFQTEYEIGFSPNINYSIDLENQEALLRGPISATSGEGFAYQWFKDGNEIDGATDSELQVTQSGAYGLRVSDQLGPQSMSNIINIALDKVAPSITSITRFTPSEEAVETDEVTFRVSFDEPVFGIAKQSFEVTGDVTGSISAVTHVQDNLVFDINVNNIQGIGLLDLNVATNSGIEDQVGNDFAGQIDNEETYTIVDLTAPQLISILRSAPDIEITNLPQVVFEVKFNENVENVDVADFELSSASITATISAVEVQSENQYLVTVSGYAEDGLIDLDMSQAHDVQDASGNISGTTAENEQTYTISADVSPTVIITRSTPLVEQTNRRSVVFELVFSENVVNFDLEDLTLSQNSVQATLVNLESISASSYKVTVQNIASEGLVELAFTSPLSVQNEEGNLFTGQVTSSQTYTFDLSVGPTATIARQEPLEEITNAQELVFEITFSGSVSKVDIGDFELSSASAPAKIASGQSISSSVYRIRVNEFEDDGLIDLNIKEGNDIEDGDGNLFSGTVTSEETYTLKGAVTAIEDNPKINTMFRVKENPSSGVFNIIISQDLPLGFEWSVANASGTKLNQGVKQAVVSGDEWLIDLTLAPNGLYILYINTGENTIGSIKLLKEGR